MPPLTPHLFVADMAASIAFYRDGMGFEVTRAEPPENPTYASLQRGDSQIMLSPFGADFEGWVLGAAARERRGQGGAISLYIEGRDLPAEQERAIAHGGTLVDPLRPRPWGQDEFTIADPNGFWWSVWRAIR